MIIERTIKEISPMQEYEKKIFETAKIVESWLSNIKSIETQIANAHSRLEKSEALRIRFALDASLGNARATAEIAKARAEHAAAAGDVNDLSHALSQGKARLSEVEGEAKKAVRILARFEAEVLMRKRVDLAGQLDTVIADFARLYSEYEKLGGQIINMPDAMPQNVHGMMNHEGTVGARRVRSALPAFLERVFPNALHDEMPKMSLATSEAQFWNLPPAETTTAAAA